MNQDQTPQHLEQTNLETKHQESPYNYLNNYSQQPIQTQNSQPSEQPNNVYIPVVYTQSHQIGPYAQGLQQPMLNNHQNTTEMKNIPFNQQKEILIKVLGVIAAGTILELFFFFVLTLIFYKVMDQIAYIMFPISLIMLIVITKVGSNKKIIEKIHPAIVFIFIQEIIVQTLIFFSQCFSHKHTSDSDNITIADIVYVMVISQTVINGLTTLFTLIYLLIENKRISYIPVLAFLVVCSIIAIILVQGFWYNCLASIVYSIFLTNGLIQITKGRFNLDGDNIMQIANSVYFTLIVPLDSSE